MTLRRIVSLLIAGLGALAACTSMPREVAAVARVPVAAFEAEGRLSVREGELLKSIGIYWEHAPNGDRVDFVTPMGQVLARLNLRPGEAILELSDGERRHAPSADRLAEQALGMKIPVGRLLGWVQAVPGADARVLRRDALGRPGLVSEDGWLVEYIAYADSGAHAPVRRIEASWGELRVSLLIDSWRAN